MKLIRVETDDRECIFDTLFNQEIVLNPYSQMALLNFSGQREDNSLIIDNNNESILYSIAVGKYKTIRLNNKIYFNNQVDELLKDLSNKLNLSARYNNSTGSYNDLGVEWLSSVINKKVNIQYKISSYDTHLNLLDKAVTINNSLSNKIYTWFMNSTQPSTSNVTNNILATKSLSNGNGFVRMRIKTLLQDQSITNPVLGDQGVLIGISKHDLSNIKPSDFTEDMIDFGIGIGYNNSSHAAYYIRQGDVINEIPQNTIIPHIDLNNFSNCDILEIMLNGDVIDFNVYQQKPVAQTITIKQVSRNINNEYYPFVIFHSNQNFCTGNLLKWTPSPYNNSQKLNDDSEDDLYNVTLIPPSNKKIVKTFIFNFSSPIVSNWLGFNNSNFSVNGTDDLNITANYIFSAYSLIFNYILELINIPLDSYDSKSKQRKNILSTIISSDEYGRIQNETNNLIFLDINNKDPLSLKNIRARLVSYDFNSILVKGTSVMTLLIKDRDER